MSKGEGFRPRLTYLFGEGSDDDIGSQAQGEDKGHG
jgi:hypothetical protein